MPFSVLLTIAALDDLTIDASRAAFSSSSFCFVTSTSIFIAPSRLPFSSNNGFGLGTTFSLVPSGRSMIISWCCISFPVFSTTAIGHASIDIGSPSGVKIFQDPHHKSLPNAGALPHSSPHTCYKMLYIHLCHMCTPQQVTFPVNAGTFDHLC